MRVVIRTDVSCEIGSGHLMRCLALADELQKTESEVLFISSNIEQIWMDFIREKNYKCENIVPSIDRNRSSMYTTKSSHCRFSNNSIDWQKDSREVKELLRYRKTDWLIVDHYGLDWRWESSMRNHTNRIMVIDDLANRKHDCDLLLDCVYGRELVDYQHLVSQGCQFLLGIKHTLLRPEFSNWRNSSLHRRRNAKKIQKILISLGGVDRENLTGTVIRLLSQADWISDAEVDVIIGHGFKHRSKVEAIIANSPIKKVTLNSNVRDMAKRIANADFGIGAFGVSTWERFCLGLPSVNIITEANQINVTTRLKRLQFAGVIFSESIERGLLTHLYRMTNDEKFYIQISDEISKLVDGKGTYRVAKQMML